MTGITAEPAAAAIAPTVLHPTAAHAYPVPPRWPEHGHRHRHPSGAVLRFDADLGAYSVAGSADVYFFHDGFLRFAVGRWLGGAGPTGPWQRIPLEWVPIRLRVKHYVQERR